MSTIDNQPQERAKPHSAPSLSSVTSNEVESLAAASTLTEPGLPLVIPKFHLAAPMNYNIPIVPSRRDPRMLYSLRLAYLTQAIEIFGSKMRVMGVQTGLPDSSSKIQITFIIPNAQVGPLSRWVDRNKIMTCVWAGHCSDDVLKDTPQRCTGQHVSIVGLLFIGRVKGFA